MTTYSPSSAAMPLTSAESLHGPTTGTAPPSGPLSGSLSGPSSETAAHAGAVAAPLRGWRAPWTLPLAFLLLQLALFVLAPHRTGLAAAYGVMVLAPFFTAGACAWRARAERTGSARLAWFALAIAMFVWSLGALDNLYEELVLGKANDMYRNAMLAFNISAVPITFVLTGEWGLRGRRLVRGIDALIALALGYGYFLFVWAMLTARGAPDEAGVAALVNLLDLQNAVLCAVAFVRWRAAVEPREREMFRSLALYVLAYFVIVSLNNRFIAADPRFDARAGSVITLAFAMLWTFARQRPGDAEPVRVDPRFVRVVRSASPIILAGALLILSLFLIRVDYPAGVAGVLIAVFGYGARNIVAQVRHIEREDSLQRDRNELRTIAWTDALTGVANRRFIDRALEDASQVRRRERRETQSYAVLMIDIDHFKGLNDHYGHVAGDTCLRVVARAMQHALARPGDVLARYGGEEFIVLLRDADVAGAQVVAERLRSAVQGLAIDHAQSPFRVVTVSVGVASAPINSGQPASKLVEAADKALYAAKCSGRNRTVVQ